MLSWYFGIDVDDANDILIGLDMNPLVKKKGKRKKQVWSYIGLFSPNLHKYTCSMQRLLYRNMLLDKLINLANYRFIDTSDSLTAKEGALRWKRNLHTE